MKNLIQYNSTVNQLFFKYLKGSIDEFSLIIGLNFIQDHYRGIIGDGKENKVLWFKFSTDDTLATTITDLERDLSNPKNKAFTMERMADSISLDGELLIYYS